MKHIRWHLIPVIGLIAIFTHSKQFDVNNPFREEFDNSDSSKDPFLFPMYQGLCVQMVILIFYHLFK